jgi:hypothetical protein
MGRLAGFRYTEIVRKLKVRGFEFDRQAAGSHDPNSGGWKLVWLVRQIAIVRGGRQSGQFSGSPAG